MADNEELNENTETNVNNDIENNGENQDVDPTPEPEPTPTPRPNMVTLVPRFLMNPPKLQTLEVTENGEYRPDITKYDGFSSVNVNLTMTELEVSGTGVWVPPDNVAGFSKVTVTSNMETIEITENGDYRPSDGYDGIIMAHVNVRPVLEVLVAEENRIYHPEGGVDGFSEVRVRLPMETLNVTTNGIYNPESPNAGFDSVVVNVGVNPPVLGIDTTENVSFYWQTPLSLEGETWRYILLCDAQVIYNDTETSFTTSDIGEGEHSAVLICSSSMGRCCQTSFVDFNV